MGFDWDKLWNVGEHLRNFSDEEEYQRSAVGRYYYSCYLLAREAYNKKNNMLIGKSISHKKLIDKLKESDDETEKEIGESLERLKKFRVNADYKINFNVNLDEAKELSKNLMNLLRKIK